SFVVLQLVLIFSLLALTGCDLVQGPQQAPGYQETLVHLQVQQTMVAQDQADGAQLTLAAQNSTLQAQEAQQAATQLAQATAALPTTDPSIAVQETIQAQQAAEVATQVELAASATLDVIQPSPTIDLK